MIAGYDTAIAKYNMALNTDKPFSLDNLIEYEEIGRLKDYMEREREEMIKSNRMLNPIHNIPFSLGAFSIFYPTYIMSLITVYFLNKKKEGEK